MEEEWRMGWWVSKGKSWENVQLGWIMEIIKVDKSYS